MAAGLIDDPDKPKTLDQAITFTGTCQDMCPRFERIRRIVEVGVDQCEKEPAEPSGKPVEERMVKVFRRPAAGIEPSLPSDVRPPAILQVYINLAVKHWRIC
jgi:nuclear mRNA export protein SAC3